MSRNLEAQDFAAAFVACVIVLGEIALSVLRIPIPAELAAAQGSALTWLFVRSAVQAERASADSRAERIK